MSRDPRVQSFLTLADEELSAAQLIVMAHPRQAAYLVQQAAEKLARAVLASEGIPFGTSHNLGQMASALAPDHAWRLKLMLLDKHSPAATRYRYPAPGGRLVDPPAQARIERDIAELRALLAEAKRGFGPR